MNENMIYDIIEDIHGSVHEATTIESRIEWLTKTEQAVDKILIEYKKNPNTINYNSVITALLAYQYWMQKKTTEFTIEADF